jgi:UDP-2-acetamido-3-amino-2,3-dideoxy-glucuronate N-acetyltransferase
MSLVAEDGNDTVIHPTAVVEVGAVLGSGVRVWHFAHIRTGANIGAGTSLGKSVFVDSGVAIGADCRIQNFVSIYRGVTLEDEVFIGPSVTFTNDDRPRANNQEWTPIPTMVRRGASIGANATVLPGLEIGAWAMIGAAALVTENVEEHSLVVGVPARRAGWVCWCGRSVAAKPSGPCPHSASS